MRISKWGRTRIVTLIQWGLMSVAPANGRVVDAVTGIAAAKAVESKITLLGDEDDGFVEVFDPETGEWIEICIFTGFPTDLLYPEKPESDAGITLEDVIITVAGIFIPAVVITEAIVDVSNGDYVGAGLSVVGMVPVIGDAAKVSGKALREVSRDSERAARRAAERETGMGKHGTRRSDDKPYRCGSQNPETAGDRGTREVFVDPSSGGRVAHDANGHNFGPDVIVPPHYNGYTPSGETRHFYPSNHDPRTNR